MNLLPSIPLLLLAVTALSGCGVPDGETLFLEKGCAGCHRFKGHGGNMGPDLTAVSSGRSSEWLRRFLKNPAAVSPATRMPRLNLTEKEIRALILYLEG